MGLFGNKQKVIKPDTDMDVKRKYRIQHGLPQELFDRLKELYEFLTIKDAQDARGYVMTDYQELKEVSGISNVFLTTLIREKIILKEPVGRAYKYKWDSIYPTYDMAMKTIEKNYEYKKVRKGEVIEPEPEIKAEDDAEKVKKDNAGLSSAYGAKPDSENSDKFVSLIDFRTEDDIMTVRVNLKQFKVEEADVIASIMSLLAGK